MSNVNISAAAENSRSPPPPPPTSTLQLEETTCKMWTEFGALRDPTADRFRRHSATAVSMVILTIR